jgi:hypothetical protein
MTVEQLMAVAESASKVATVKKEAPFTSYTCYMNEHYIGNFSLPENFTDSTKDAVLSAMKAIGLELRAPGSTKRELSLTDLGVKA